ncbi:MAG TPA: DUF433 domain-containing protein [Ktedonobacterales bacterium]|jgi:uncharacterized protein (DUF433 family)
MALQLYPHISADARVLSGQPVIEGTSVAVSLVVTQVATGKTISDVAREHGVSIEDIRAALEYAAQRTSEPIALAADAKNDEGSGQADAGSPMAEEEARRLGLDPKHLSPLGRRLLELRAQAIAAGEPLLTTWEELDAEIAERRGGIYPDADA